MSFTFTKTEAGMPGDAGLAWRLFNLNWIPVIAMATVMLAVAGLSDFSIEPIAFGISCAVGLSLASAAYIYYFTKPDQARLRLVFTLGAVAQIVLAVVIVGPLSYVVLAINFPLQDNMLAAIDHLMGFDSRSVILFVNDHPGLSSALALGYGMIKWPLLVIPLVLASTRRWIRLQQFVMALNVAMLITVVVSIFVPAIGNYQVLGLAASDVPNVDVVPFLLGQHDIPAVRDGSLRHLRLFKLAGVVTFPSFHAASAVLFAWAFATVRGWGPIALVVNTLMLASTPVIGGHYLIDVVVGVALAGVSIVFAKWLTDREEQWRTRTLVPRWLSSRYQFNSGL